MINLHSPKKISVARRLAGALLVLGLLTSVAVQAADEQRWLFIFNTSATMKKRLPAVESEIKILFTSAFGGNLHAGDSVGVWTFDEKLRAGEFPLLTWEPARAAETATNLIAFIQKQRYAGSSSLDALQPLLDRVIADSERLTVVIVCDGASEIKWTPYNTGINDTLRSTADERKKTRQPYVILLRMQQGKYIGATVNFPPTPANVPPFPLLPREIKTVPTNPPVKIAVVPPVKPPVAPVVPALIIVGTRVSTDTNEIAKLSPATNSASPGLVVATNPVVTNHPPLAVMAKPVLPAKSNFVATVGIATNSPALTPATNPVVALTGTHEDATTRSLIYVGIGLLVIAILLVIFLLLRNRRAPPSSLITSSMQGDSRPPERK